MSNHVDDSRSFLGREFGARIAVEARLHDLSAEARQLLGVASLLGLYFDTSLMAKIAGLPPDSLNAALDELEQAQLVSPEGRDGVRHFIHGIVPEISYEGVPAALRARYLPRIASAVEELCGTRDGARNGDIAVHLIESMDSGLAALAVERTLSVAQRLLAEGRFAEAAQTCERALEALEKSRTRDDRFRFELLIKLASAHAGTRNDSEAMLSFRRAAQLAEHLGDSHKLAEVVFQLPLLNWPAPGLPNSFAALLAERVLSHEQADGGERAMVQARLAAELSNISRGGNRAEKLAAEALQATAGSSDLNACLYVRRRRDAVLRDPDLIQERIANAEQVIRLAQQAGDYGALCESLFNRAFCLLELGEVECADAESELMVHAAGMSRDPMHEGVALAYQCVRASMEGNLDRLEDCARRCRALAGEQRIPHLWDLVWPSLMKPLAEQTRLAELEPIALETRHRRPNEPVWAVMISWLRLKQGKEIEARFDYERAAASDLAEMRRRGGYLACLAMLTEIACVLKDRAGAAHFHELLLPYSDRVAVLGPAAVFGSISRYLGLAAVTLDRLDDAIASFERAISQNRRIGAAPSFAYSIYDLASVFARIGESRRQQALDLAARSYAEASRLGLNQLAMQTREMLSRLEPPGSSGRVGLDENHQRIPIMTKPTAYSVVETSGESARPASRATVRIGSGTHMGNFHKGAAVDHDDAEPVGVFRREGGNWALGYSGKVVRTKHLKGLSLIALLLSRPGERLHVFELDDLTGEPGDVGEVVESSETGPALDAAAKAAYQGRLRELREELEEANSLNDLGRAAKLDEEMAFITRELARAVGLYGRDRNTASRTERTRVRVTNAIRSALTRISDWNEPLGCYLNRTIKTGTFCCYLPDLGATINWRL